MAEAELVEEQSQPQQSRTKRGISLRMLNAVMVIIAAAIAIVFLQGVQESNDAFDSLQDASSKYIECEAAASDMKAGSNYLTIQVRSFVVTQNLDYLNNYFWEADENQRRQAAVETLERLQGDESSASLKAALDESLDLMNLEYYAMRLVCEAKGYNGAIDAHLADVQLSAQDAALSPEEQIALAQEIVFGDEYMDYVADIEDNVANCRAQLIAKIESIQSQSQNTLYYMMGRQGVLAILLFIAYVAISLSIVVLVLWPLRTFSAHIKDNEPLPTTGATELHELSASYNVMYDENMRSYDILRQKAEHDTLTGLYNRSVFERLLEMHATDNYAIMIVDADYFKSINDTLGHDGGDLALCKIANQLSHAFRSSDYPCRIGGDEFAVFMTEMTPDLRSVVAAKVETIRANLAEPSDGLPALTVSIGIAFSGGELTGEQVFKHADQALFKVKEAGRNGYGFYED